MYTTDAIVLKKMDVGEQDALYMLYTRDYGKMRAVAAGIKKQEAKLRGHLEPLSLSRVRFVMGRGREKLIGASLMNFWHGIRANAEKLAAAHYVASRIDRECMEGDRDPALWELLTACFQTLDVQKNFEDPEEFFSDFDGDLRQVMGYGGPGASDPENMPGGMHLPDYGIIKEVVL